MNGLSGRLRLKALLLSLVCLVASGCAQPAVDYPFEEVRYQITGGVAGFDRTLRIAADGSYRLTDEGREVRTGRISSADLRELKQLLKAIEWEDLKSQYVDRAIADSLFRTVSLRTGLTSRTVTVGTGGEPPAAVAALVSLLDRLTREARMR